MISIWLSLFLAALIIGCEILRPKKHGVFDFLRGTSAIYFIAFVIVPIYLQCQAQFNPQLLTGWMFRDGIDGVSFIYAGSIALVGYLGICSGYLFSADFFRTVLVRQPTADLADIPKKDFSGGYLFALGILFALIGSAAFFVYASEVGGFWHMLKYSGAYRSSIEIKSNYAFLRNIAPLLLVASYLLHASGRQASSPAVAWVRKVFFAYTFVASLVLLFHQAGRLNLITYILIFPLTRIAEENRLRWRTLLFGGLLFTAVILFGKELFQIILDPLSLNRKLEVLVEGERSGAFHHLMLEFAFPLVTLANATGYVVPEIIPYRYFVDVILAFISLLPQKLLEMEMPETISQLNTAFFGTGGTIPVDLVSFGYFNLGVPGVFLTTFFFGLLLCLFEYLLPARGGPGVQIMRVAWILFLAFRVMYGDPEIALRPGFYLIFSTILLFGGWTLLQMTRHSLAKPAERIYG